jgi:5-bromo-4-chloroindolyl phosphate hydrolysis protein
VWHFSAFPFLTAETMLDAHDKVKEKYSLFKEKFENLYVESDLWSFRQSQETVKLTHNYNNCDDHPTPQCHWNWLNQVVAPAMNIQLDNLSEEVAIDQKRVLNGDVDFNNLELYKEKDNAKN